MNNMPENNTDPLMFDTEFFVDYEQQLADIDFEAQASLALADIMKIENEDGSRKTLEEIRHQSTQFFASDWVRESEARMNRLAAEFAQACMGHDHGSELASGGTLGTIFEKGVSNLYGTRDQHNHEHGESDDDADDEEHGHKNDKDKKKKRRHSKYRKLGLLAMFSKY